MKKKQLIISAVILVLVLVALVACINRANNGNVVDKSTTAAPIVTPKVKN